MKRIFMSIKENFLGRLLLVESIILSISSIAYAEGDTDISSITSQITTALTSAKSDFVTALGAVVVVAVGFFIVKFVVKQVISYFAKIASK